MGGKFTNQMVLQGKDIQGKKTPVLTIFFLSLLSDSEI